MLVMKQYVFASEIKCMSRFTVLCGVGAPLKCVPSRLSADDM